MFSGAFLTFREQIGLCKRSYDIQRTDRVVPSVYFFTIAIVSSSDGKFSMGTASGRSVSLVDPHSFTSSGPMVKADGERYIEQI